MSLSNTSFFSKARLSDFFELTKPRLTSLVLMSTMVGFFLAISGSIPWGLLLWTLAGTGLVAAGSMALNQWMEQDVDQLMVRTRVRPLPEGRLRSGQAFVFGVSLSVAGLLFLGFQATPLSAALAGLTSFFYLALYTPLKKKTPWNTIVGAVPGAIPPLVGWAAVTGQLSWAAAGIFLIVFFWQIPHFYSISWMCREDYAKAGLKMLSVLHPDGKKIGQQMILCSLLLIPVSFLPSVFGKTGALYLIAASVLGTVFLVYTVVGQGKLDKHAKGLFRFSILYLFLLFLVMLLNKVG